MTRINLGKVLPKVYQAMAQMDKEVNQMIAESGIKSGFAHLLKLHISQLNGCAFCIRLHMQDASKDNESYERISLLSVRHETKYYTEEELVALDLAEAITLVAADHIPDAIYHKATQTLGEQKVAAVEWLSVTMNAWNRIGIASRYEVAPVE
ncbi:carboxymuconolactone decarboxylase family protein [Zophobihabitans entericus]|uniref:Carboxymuconolactone decarboxylase family protein n=1 Tax=Zophobihabitans entericus TaxID=1635327 RepID=A0A6G9I9M8_9GAMM|nr:carboxymuconolactone decarboxylase family protein [Zophobihabitans entericus]QIQ20434.1 carboxymuconolactone decarboxylase family protein [Zophobihabitans entericus]